MLDPSDLAMRAQARVGSTLHGKYRIDSVLGIGGMGVVYAATHRNTKRFAVKMLHAELSHNADIRTRFLREGYAANSVGHPGTVSVLDDDVAEDGAAFLVMELLDGAGVEDLCEKYRGRLPVRASVVIVEQLLDVLASAHVRGIVHRDIKPANIFLTRDGTLKVLDFGMRRRCIRCSPASSFTKETTRASSSSRRRRNQLARCWRAHPTYPALSPAWSIEGLPFRGPTGGRRLRRCARPCSKRIAPSLGCCRSASRLRSSRRSSRRRSRPQSACPPVR